MIRPEDLCTRHRPISTFQRIIAFPLSRLVIAIAFLTPVALLHNLSYDFLKGSFEGSLLSWLLLIEGFINVVLFILSYRLFTRVVERRPGIEFSMNGASLEIGAGSLIGGALVAITVLVMYLSGCNNASEVGSWDSLIHLGRRFLVGAFIEELIFRVLVFRLLEELIGSLWSFLVVATLFGLAHLGNPNATILSVALTAGSDLLLISAFMFTRRIWLCWGIHFGWNFAQSAIFGMANSGYTNFRPFLTPTITGPEWLTGGAFGIEASIFAFVLVMLAASTMLATTIKNSQTMLPKWRRSESWRDEAGRFEKETG